MNNPPLKTNYNNNSTSNILTINNNLYEYSVLEAKNFLSGKNFLNSDFYNNLNLNNNLKDFSEYLKNENTKQATSTISRNHNYSILNMNNKQSPILDKKFVDKFSKTSNNFEFNIIENLDVINLNTDISLIEENLKMNKGEFIKRLKSLYDNFNNSQNKFMKNTYNNNQLTQHTSTVQNKSYYQNTSMIDRDKNTNITRIETIFENYEVSLEEMILISSSKSTRKLGHLKKMLHTANLNLYVVRVYK
jgi:hypothetical protein